jgi:hypothetical protein
VKTLREELGEWRDGVKRLSEEAIGEAAGIRASQRASSAFVQDKGKARRIG